MALDDDTRQKLQQLREEFNLRAQEAARQTQAALNTEKTANSPLNKKKGGIIKSASSRADGIAQRGKTRGKYC